MKVTRAGRIPVLVQLREYRGDLSGAVQRAVPTGVLQNHSDAITYLLAPIINANVGYYLYCARQYEQAVQELRKATEVDPAFSWTRMSLGRAYALQRRGKEAEAELTLALSLSKRNLREVAFAASCAAFLGQREAAKQLLQELLGVSRKRYVAPYLPAFTYASLNEKDRAFEYLEQAFQERSISPWLLRDPLLDGIRSDPRFQSLLQRMGIPP